MMLLALSWADAFAITMLVSALAFTLIVIAENFSPAKKAALGNGPRARELADRQEEIADDIVAIRSDLAEIKQSLAELDRLFKSVG